MTLAWSNLVNEVFRKLEDLLLVCSSCSSSSVCIDRLSNSLPMDIQVLSECCACMLENILDSTQNIDRIYSTTETGEDITIYRLSDAVIEISSTSAIVIPMTRLESYLEIIEESGYRDAETIKKWLSEKTNSTPNYGGEL